MQPDVPTVERRPHPRLLLYDALRSLLLGPLFPALLIPRAIRWRTLRYTFAPDGISMRWGALFRREVHLSYERIQDIHVRTNVAERWLGLGRLLIQTASASAVAEVTIEGLPDFEALRDRVYARMAGGTGAAEARGAGAPAGVAREASADAVAARLDAVAAELAEVRRLLAPDEAP